MYLTDRGSTKAAKLLGYLKTPPPVSNWVKIVYISQIVFILEVFIIFVVVFIFQVVFIFHVFFTFDVIFLFELIFNLGTSSRHCSRSALGDRLATTVVDCYFPHYFHFFPYNFFVSVANFSHRRSAWIKTTYLAKVDGSAQKSRGRTLSRSRRPF